MAAIITTVFLSGKLAVDSAVLAADALASLWKGSLPARLVFGVVEPVSAKEIQRHAKRDTKVFLRAYWVAARQESVAVGRTRLDMLGVAPI